ncbi:hypothetical protein ACJMK2_032235 [Sinanodonta woodiana]|uniref:Uncharacterized protein n=1 Tax=Sinanodonta woodiana TaxID=1069815 RepID=A0ABD3X148_SINWO
MATWETTATSTESHVKDVTDSKQSTVPETTTSSDEVELPTEEQKSKPDGFNEWCQNVVRDFEHIKDEKKIKALKHRVIHAEEQLESIKEGYSIDGRLRDTNKAIETLRKRLNIPNENSKNVDTNISVSQEYVLKTFEEMYAQWNEKFPETDRDCELCKVHEECHEFCKKWFQDQMKKLLIVARPQSRDQSYTDTEEQQQIIEEAYKELARNTVGTELAKVKTEGSKEIKVKPDLKTFVPKCLDICWITLLLKEQLLFEFNSEHAKEGTFKGTKQNEVAIVIKPAVLLDKDTIKIQGMVRQRQVDANEKEVQSTDDNGLALV